MKQGATPTRTLEQRMTALKHAQEIRLYRARLKQEVKSGEVDVVDLMDDPLCETMKVGDALIAQHRVGKTKRNRILTKTGISPGRSFGGLSERQREELIDALRH
jgi:hypothetical protein